MKVVFLDRDGVVNALERRGGNYVSPRFASNFRLLPGVPEAVKKLKSFGYAVVVVTNQPDIARRCMDEVELKQMTERVMKLGVDGVFICPHDNADNCECRKPKAGLLTRYLNSLDALASELWMVGDNATDIIAGRVVGARTILITRASSILEPQADFFCESLVEAVEIITDS